MTDAQARFWSNFRTLAAANAASLALMVGLAPVLSWLYPPAAFGYLAYFMFAFQLAIAVCTWRFDWLVPNARSTSEEIALLVLGGSVLMLVCVLLAAGIAMAPAALQTWEGYAAVGPYLFLLPVAVMGVGLRLLVSARFVRTSTLRPVSFVKICETAGNGVLAILLGLAGFALTGLLVARVAASWFGIGYLLRRQALRRADLARLSRRRVWTVLVRSAGRATGATWVSFFNALSLGLPIVVLGWFGTVSQLGLYLMATQLISTPLRIGANALSQSFWARSAELARVRNFSGMHAEYVALLWRLAPVALAAGVLVVPVSYAAQLVFPPEWDGLGQILRAVAPIIPGLVVASSTNHLVVLERAHWQFLADAGRLVLMLGSITALAGAGYPFWVLVLAVSLSSLAGHALLLALHLLAYAHLLRGSPPEGPDTAGTAPQ